MKRTTPSTRWTWRNILLVMVFAIILFIVLDPDNRRSPDNPLPTLAARPSETHVLTVQPPTVPPMGSLTVVMTATPPPAIPSPSPTLPPMATNRLQPTEEPVLAITPVAPRLYDVTGTANALRCPDTRCKVIETYKRKNILVVTGVVTGTSYKGDKTKVWMQVISHEGTKVYVHASFLTPHTG